MRITHADLEHVAAAVERWRVAQGNVDAICTEREPEDVSARKEWVDSWFKRYDVAKARAERDAHTVACYAEIACEAVGLVPKRRV